TRMQGFRAVEVRVARGGGSGGTARVVPAAQTGADEGLARATAAAAELPAVEDVPASSAGLDVLPAAPRAADVFATPAGPASTPLDGFVDPRRADARLGVASNLKASGRYEEAF